MKLNYSITSAIAHNLTRIETAKAKILKAPLTLSTLKSLRETARLYSTHYSTMIEGNRLKPEEIEDILYHEQHVPGKSRDEGEVRGYYAALGYVEKMARDASVEEHTIQMLHALVMGQGKKRVVATPYRTGQNVIRDGRTRIIVYLPPQASDVPVLMAELVTWLNASHIISCPVVAAIAHYQFVTIHPYYDGNGRTARLLTNLILYQGGYDLKGLYSLEEYYARHLGSYYEALTVGPSHNYYEGRVEADITQWIEYFIEGMAYACESALKHMLLAESRGETDQQELLRLLDAKQRRVLELLSERPVITSHDVAKLLHFKPRTSSQLCKKWVGEGFLEVVDASKKGRSYKLAMEYEGFRIKKN